MAFQWPSEMETPRRILLVEPHADDLILSAHLHLMRLKDLNYDLHLATISNMPGPEWVRSSGPKSAAVIDSPFNWSPYVDEIGAKYVWYDQCEDIDLRVHKMNFREVTKHPNPWTCTWNHFLHKFRDYYDVVVFPVVKESILRVKPDVVWSPLGIWHPMHIGVRYCIEKMLKDQIGDPFQRVYYADYPYVSNKYGQAILGELQQTHKCISRILGTEEEVKAKQALMPKCYPSVANILRFSGPPMFTIPEELYV